MREQEEREDRGAAAGQLGTQFGVVEQLAVEDNEDAPIFIRDRLLAEVAERLSEYFPQMALTPREVEVLRLVAQGYSNKDVMQTLGISEKTVKAHLTNIFQRIGVSDESRIRHDGAPI